MAATSDTALWLTGLEIQVAALSTSEAPFTLTMRVFPNTSRIRPVPQLSAPLWRRPMSGQARRSNVWREFWKLDQSGLCFVLFLLIPLSACLHHREDVLRSGYNHRRHKSNVSIFFLCGLQPKLAPGEHSLLLSMRPPLLTVTSPPSISPL